MLEHACSQYLNWLLQSIMKKAARKCRRLIEWGEPSSPGDFLMRWGDPEAMWMDRAGTAATEVWEEKEANIENLLCLHKVLAAGHCGISTSIYEWKAAYPNFSSIHNSGNWMVLDVEALWPFLPLFTPPGTSEPMWTPSHSKLTSCLTVTTRKPQNLEAFRLFRGTYILSHLAF